jgi:hypothetical protein
VPPGRPLLCVIPGDASDRLPGDANTSHAKPLFAN